MTTRFSPGEPSDWKFHIVAPDGTIRTEFDEAHGQRGHLIVVRRDLTRFQHLHPTLENDGTWRVEAFTLPDPGIYRAFLDLMIDGRPITLGFDIFAPGPLKSRRARKPRATQRPLNTMSNSRLTRFQLVKLQS
ncbi:hypothetical protein ACFFQF_22830 [Haladaptatus pallidirubidus]|uniref:hypothetical protein n=1 Tax=Haladaptatus pallidirubidus TaxID=1008152 RepID=UPI0035EB3FA3